MSNIDFKYIARCYKEEKMVEEHVHPGCELIYYIAGTGTSVIGKSRYEYKKGTFVFVPEDTVHSEIHNTATDVIFFAFERGDFFKELNRGSFLDESGEILELFLKIKDEVDGGRPYAKYCCELYIEQVLLNILRRIVHIQNDSATMERLIIAKNYIKLNTTGHITVKEVAGVAGYSVDYFRHQFAKHFGISVKDYILKTRIRHVKEYLVKTDYSIGKIAEKFCFKSVAHLSLSFKKIEGCSPTEYRKNNTGTDVENISRITYL